MPHPYGPETAGAIMIRNIPTSKEEETVGEVLKMLGKGDWDDSHVVVVVSDHGFLLGLVPVHRLLTAKKDRIMRQIMQKVRLSVQPTIDQENVVFDAIHKDVQFVPVVDAENHFLGAITSDQIVDILHKEHFEDLLHSSGIQGKLDTMADLVTASLRDVVFARLPWLLIGLTIGFIASLIISRFELFLHNNVQIAFFISMVAYMSGAMNTQSEILFIRALTVMKFNITKYLIREFGIGVCIGAIVGGIAGIGAYMLSSSFAVAITVALSLLISMSLSTILACLVPLLLKSWGKDPAIGSGPFATALQDLLSITIYFLIALAILGGA